MTWTMNIGKALVIISFNRLDKLWFSVMADDGMGDLILNGGNNETARGNVSILLWYWSIFIPSDWAHADISLLTYIRYASIIAKHGNQALEVLDTSDLSWEYS